jgi:ankyrin repeat protein
MEMIDLYNGLTYAAEEDNVTVAKLCLENGADIHADDDIVLYIAVKEGNINVTRFLLEKGAITDNNRVDCVRFLKKAVSEGFNEIADMLLEYGVDVEPLVKDTFWFQVACYEDKRNLVAWMIKYGVDINADNGEALKEAVRRGAVKIVDMLLKAGANVDLEEALRRAVENNEKGKNRKGIIKLLEVKIKEEEEGDVCN